MTQASLVTKAGLYRITIAKIEGGQFVPSLPALARIARAWKTEPWKLLKDRGSESPAGARTPAARTTRRPA
jgi:transcriptional regulator with XRE-family HTH domain